MWRPKCLRSHDSQIKTHVIFPFLVVTVYSDKMFLPEIHLMLDALSHIIIQEAVDCHTKHHFQGNMISGLQMLQCLVSHNYVRNYFPHDRMVALDVHRTDFRYNLSEVFFCRHFQDSHANHIIDRVKENSDDFIMMQNIFQQRIFQHGYSQ